MTKGEIACYKEFLLFLSSASAFNLDQSMIMPYHIIHRLPHGFFHPYKTDFPSYCFNELNRIHKMIQQPLT